MPCPCEPWCRPSMNRFLVDAEEGADDGRVKLAAAVAQNLCQSLLRREGLPVGPGRSHGIEGEPTGVDGVGGDDGRVQTDPGYARVPGQAIDGAARHPGLE